jgi:hypothetical protein
MLDRMGGLLCTLVEVSSGRIEAQVSDIFGINACVAVQAIAHFFDEELTFSRAGIIRL